MADAPARAPESKSAFGFLGKKVFGKIPVWVIAVAAVGGYYWYSHRKGAAGQQTDPAGNTCTAVNPATGYCPGTPEDLAAQQANAGTDTTGTDTTGAGTGTGTDQSGGSAGSAGGTAGSATGGTDTGTSPLLTWTDQSGQVQTGTASDFQSAFAATGTNAGQIVPGGTGQPVPLPPGQSYTDAGPSAAAKPGAQNAHAQHLAHVAHLEHLKHQRTTRKTPAKVPARG